MLSSKRIGARSVPAPPLSPIGSDDDKANILVVDDRPDKLLALQAILEELGQNIVDIQDHGGAPEPQMPGGEHQVIRDVVNVHDVATSSGVTSHHP